MPGPGRNTVLSWGGGGGGGGGAPPPPPPPADMAKRVEGEGEADCVFLTDRVRALLPPGKVEDEEVRAVTLKGDNHATTLYRVRGCAGEDPRAFRNPFLVGGPVMEPTDFYGREREVNSALARLQGMQSVSVVGPRRIGKSSLLHYLLHVLPDQLGPDYRTVFIDLLHPRARSVAGVLGEIQRQLGLEHPADTLAEFAGRMDRLHREGVRPVIALDELEVFVRLCAEFSEEFCEALRALASDRQLALLTASRAPLRELHDQGALVSPWYNIMGLVRLGPFTADEAREFVTAPRAGVAFTAEQVEAILQRGAGHPLCLQSYCWHAAQTNHAERTDWAAVWQEAADEIDQMLAGQ